MMNKFTSLYLIILNTILNRHIYELYVCLFITKLASAQDTITLSDISEHYFIKGEYLGILEDPNNQYSIDSVCQSTKLNFYQQNGINGLKTQNDDSKSTYWIRFKVTKSTPSDWIIEFPNQHIDEIEFYVPDSQNNYTKFISGNQLPFRSRTFNHRNIEFKLPLQENRLYTFYVKVTSEYSTILDSWIRSDQKFTGYAINEYVILGMFYGIVILMISFNLMLFIYVKNKAYLFYVFYVIGIGWYSLSRNGLGFQYLWPEHPEWNSIVTYLAIIFAVVSQLFYSKYFLQLNRNAPLLNTIISYFIVIRIVIFIIGFCFFRSLLTFLPLDIISLSVSFFAGIVAYKNGYKPARLFLLGFGFLCIGFIICSIESVGLFTNDIIHAYASDIGASFEILFLSLAFADQLRTEKKAKESAQKDSIRELRRNESLKKNSYKKTN